jgi:hypothetical protein
MIVSPGTAAPPEVTVLLEGAVLLEAALMPEAVILVPH